MHSPCCHKNVCLNGCLGDSGLRDLASSAPPNRCFTLTILYIVQVLNMELFFNAANQEV